MQESPRYTRRKAKSSPLTKLAASYKSEKGLLKEERDHGSPTSLSVRDSGDYHDNYRNRSLHVDDLKEYRPRSKSTSSSHDYHRSISENGRGWNRNIYMKTDNYSSDQDSRSNDSGNSPKSNGHYLLKNVHVLSDDEELSSDDQIKTNRSSSSEHYSSLRRSREDPRSYRRDSKDLLRRSGSESTLRHRKGDVDRYRESLEQLEEDESRDVLRSLRLTSTKIHRNNYPSQPQLGSSTNFQHHDNAPLFTREYTESIDSDRSGRSGLSQLSIKDARARSITVDGINTGNITLGLEELERCFPERQMRVFVGTYNMGEMKEVPKTIDDFILPENSDGFLQDIYAIGAQECLASVMQEWELLIQATLGQHYVPYHSASHGTLHLVIFVRRDIIWYTSVPQDASMSTRLGPSGIRTKGAIGISFEFFGTTLLFINCHLTAHDGKFLERIEDYKKICSGLTFSRSSNKGGDITMEYDCVFWMGDFNCRIEKDREHVEKILKKIESNKHPDTGLCDFSALLQYDELQRVMNQGLAFNHFKEGRIKFRPTYKYDINNKDANNKNNTYDSSTKQRVPSYTDRVLFRTHTKNGAGCTLYNSALTVRDSDHRPVYGIYDVALKPGSDKNLLSGGQFNRNIWLEGNKRRERANDTEINNGIALLRRAKGKTTSSICLVM